MDKHKNIIITIGRQVGSGGHVIGKLLSKELGFQFYDKEILDLAAKESGFNKKVFEENDECKGSYHTYFHARVPIPDVETFYKPEFSMDNIYNFQSIAIRKAAEENNCVFVGRTADYVLRNHPNKVSFFITANEDSRIKAVEKRLNVSREKAKKFIEDKEEERASYYNYYTGKKWGATTSYDLCINSSVLGIEETKKFLAYFVKMKFQLE